MFEAAGWHHPAILIGLLLAAIPLLIHLLHRRQHSVEPWAALMFVRKAREKHSRRLRLQAITLLAMRTLAVVAAVTALAGPYFTAADRDELTSAPQHRILVLDNSLSMSAVDGTQSSFEAARQIARQIVDESQPGDLLNLVRIGEVEPLAVIRQPAHDLSAVRQELSDLAATAERGDVALAFAEVADCLERLPNVPRKSVHIISDFQRTQWAADEAASERHREMLEQIARRSELVIYPVSERPRPNLAVTSLASRTGVAIEDQRMRVTAKVRRLGSPAESAHIELLLNDLVADVQSPVFNEQDTATAVFQFSVPHTDDLVVTARVADDVLQTDNVRHMVRPVRSAIRVLLVDGGAAPRLAATEYLRVALQPVAGGSSSAGVQMEVVSHGALHHQELTDYDVVWLADVPLVTKSEAARLRQYVRFGGGLVISPGGQVDLENYNRNLFDLQSGLLPVSLVEVADSAVTGEPTVSFEQPDQWHPLLRVFEGNPKSGLTTSPVQSYVRINLQPAEGDGERRDAETVLTFPTDDPAIVVGRFGSGRIVMYAMAVDTQWGEWPLWPSFLPLVHETVAYVAATDVDWRNLQVGRPIVRSLQDAVDAAATVIDPDGQRRSVAVEDGSTLVFDDTDRAGIYRLRVAPPVGTIDSIAVNPDPRESDLTPIDVRDSDTLLLADVPYRLGSVTGSQRGVGNRSGTANPLHLALLGVVLATLLIEQVMAWNFRFGVYALLVIAGAAMCGIAWSSGWLPGAAMTILLIAIPLLRYSRGLVKHPEARDKSGWLRAES